MYLKICAYCCCCLFGMCRLFVQSLVLSSYHSVCLCLCTEVFWCWKWKDVSPSCVRLLARCLSHAMPVSLWECSLVKKSVSGGESCKKKEIDKKKLVPEEKKGRRRWSSPFLSCKYWMLYTYYIYIIYMLCMLQHLWGLFSYFFCLFNGTVNSLVKSWFFLCIFMYI